MARIRLIVFLLLILISSFSLFLFNQNKNKGNLSQTNQTVTPDISTQSYVSPISVPYLRTLNIQSEALKIEQELPNGSNYKRYIASYLSEGNKVYGLLTVPMSQAPYGGFPSIVFCHGYIPPTVYVTTKSYVAYVDSLARNNFVVFKIDFRGNGNSEGDASGSYFSSAYTIDAISALKSLQKFDRVNPNRIGIWGHSMSGNVVLRAMEVSNEIKAGVIWAGAVYSYKDFATYGIKDTSYTHRPDTANAGGTQKNREISAKVQQIRSDPKSIDFTDSFWTSVSLTKNIEYLTSPLQIHHATNDQVVEIEYSRDLAKVLKDTNKKYELYEYAGGGHNISSPYFETAMERTIQFFRGNL